MLDTIRQTTNEEEMVPEVLGLVTCETSTLSC